MKTENIWRNLKSLVHDLWLVSSYESLKCAASLYANFPKVSASKLRLAELDWNCKKHGTRFESTCTEDIECQSERIKIEKIFKRFPRFEHEQTLWNVRNPEWFCSRRTRSAKAKVMAFLQNTGTGTRGMPCSQVWMQYKMLAFRLANLVRDFHANKCCVTS